MCVAIKIENVNKSFGETVVLSNVNIEFEKGKVHGLIGRNGSGKTSLLKSLIDNDLLWFCTTIIRTDYDKWKNIKERF